MTLQDDLLRSGFTRHRGIFYQDGLHRDQSFENHYIKLREKENRMYADAVVCKLPVVPNDHPLRSEWQVRSRSCAKMVAYLQREEGGMKILEVGCGNGWLSNQLAMLPQSQVIGIDINETELLQAARVFNQVKNLVFAYADVFNVSFPFKFNCIIFASVIQYFPDLSALIRQALELLTDNGEIHILDSPFYKREQLHSAKERSKAYFTQQGSAMTPYYFHHDSKDLQEFNARMLINPATALNRIRRYFSPASPFPWIVITR